MKTGEQWLGLAVVLVFAVAGTAQADLIAHWNFNEGTGTLAEDVTANSYDGTLENLTWVTGLDGTAVDFDGLNDDSRVTIADPTDALSPGELFEVPSG